MRLLLFLLLTLATTAAAKTPAEKSGDLVRRVKKGASITVTAFDEKLHAFALTVSDEPAVGPNYADPVEIRKSIEFDGNTDSMMKNKERMIGSVYQLKNPLRLLTENQVIKRRKTK